jgi:hypothetical protein
MYPNNIQCYEQTYMQKVLNYRIGQELQNIANPHRTGIMSEYIIIVWSDSKRFKFN